MTAVCGWSCGKHQGRRYVWLVLLLFSAKGSVGDTYVLFMVNYSIIPAKKGSPVAESSTFSKLFSTIAELPVELFYV